MRKLNHLLLFSILFITQGLVLNGQRDCQTMENLAFNKAFIAGIESRMQDIERHTQNVSQQIQMRSSEKVIEIPVVVHILYNTSAENIPEDVILSQIDVLNEDFQRLNSDQTEDWAQAANTNFDFRLATVAPDGSETNGIVRKHTTKSYFLANNEMKFNSFGGSDAWPTDQYLNIWVCDLYSGKMGYAQLPGGGSKLTDGVVIDYAFFGRTHKSKKYGLGRTATHEVGHWLNLRHIWGDGGCGQDDHVHDTPAASYPSYGCQSGRVSCGSKDMVENFMDYSHDQCMNLFTEGQKTRMRALFEPGGFRESILHSKGLGNDDPMVDVPLSDCPNGDCDDVETPTEEEVGCPSPENLLASIDGRYFTASWDGDSDKYLFEIKLPYSNRWFGFELTKREVSISGLQPGLKYESRVKALCNDGTDSDYADFDISTSRLNLDAGRHEYAPIKAYPNPAVDVLTVEWRPTDYILPNLQDDINDLVLMSEMQEIPSLQMVSPSPTIISSIEMYDLSGRMVINQRVNPGEYFRQIEVGHLNPGMFILVQRGSDGRILAQDKIKVVGMQGR